MKKLVYVLLGALFFLAVEVTVAAPPAFPEKPYEYTLDTSWKKVNSPIGNLFPDNYVYKKNENFKLNIIFNLKNKAGLPLKGTNEIHPDFLAGRKKVMEAIGMTNWKVTQHEILKKDQTTSLSIIGSSTLPDGKAIKFEERHYFEGEKYVMARLSYGEKDKDEKALSSARKSFDQLKMR